jgi:MFS family permease
MFRDYYTIKVYMRILATQDGLPRVSWGSVIAGVILSLITYLILSVLGAAIGTSTLSPMPHLNSPQGFGLATGAYLIVMTAIAVFVGSYFAGRLAPALGWLHGLLAWAVMILVIGYGATSLLGSAVSAAGSVASTGAMTGPLTHRVQGAIASATAVASSPQAEADAREAAHTAARGIARASWFSFAALMVGAIIAVLSGHAGYRRQPPFAEARGASTDDVVWSRDSERRVLPAEPSV